MKTVMAVLDEVSLWFTIASRELALFDTELLTSSGALTESKDELTITVAMPSAEPPSVRLSVGAVAIDTPVHRVLVGASPRLLMPPAGRSAKHT